MNLFSILIENAIKAMIDNLDLKIYIYDYDSMLEKELYQVYGIPPIDEDSVEYDEWLTKTYDTRKSLIDKFDTKLKNVIKKTMLEKNYD